MPLTHRNEVLPTSDPFLPIFLCTIRHRSFVYLPLIPVMMDAYADFDHRLNLLSFV